MRCIGPVQSAACLHRHRYHHLFVSVVVLLLFLQTGPISVPDMASQVDCPLRLPHQHLCHLVVHDQ